MFDDTATNDSGDEDKRIPTFCLIKGIPAEINFDDKSLRIALKQRTVGFRKCMMMSVDDVQKQQRQFNNNSIDNDAAMTTSQDAELLAKTYAIALFESKEAALDAAEPGKIQLVIENGKPPVSLTIIPMQGDKALAPEAIFKDTITIDGEEIPKSDLADTTGLSSALKSFAGFREAVALEKGNGGIAKWCNLTKKGQDCPRGNQCWNIHLKKYQTSITPKLMNNQQQQQQQNQTEEDEQMNVLGRREREGGDASAIATSVEDEYEKQQSIVIVPKPACQAMINVTNNNAIRDWRLPGGRTILVPRKEIEAVFSSQTNSQILLQQQIQVEMDSMKLENSTSRTAAFFVKFDFPHGSASDMRMRKWKQSSPTATQNLYEGIDATPKPLRRDVLMHSCMKESQSSLSVTNAEEAINLLKSSLKAATALKKYLKHLDAGTNFYTDNNNNNNNNNNSVIPIRIDYFQKCLWCPPSQYSILLKMLPTNSHKSQNQQKEFMGAAQRVDWMIVDVANRRSENSAEVTAQQHLETEQRVIVDDWRQISADGLKEVLENLDFSSSGATISSGNYYFCVNVAVLGEDDGKFVRLDSSTISRPRILSIHDADESIRKSALLPFCGKSAASFRITWRTRTPFPEQVPKPIQEILEQYGNGK